MHQLLGILRCRHPLVKKNNWRYNGFDEQQRNRISDTVLWGKKDPLLVWFCWELKFKRLKSLQGRGHMIRVDQMDKHLDVSTTINEPDLVWLDAKQFPFALYGVMYDESCHQYVRLPDSVAQTVSEGVVSMNRHTSGGRLRFRTDSSYIAIRAVMAEKYALMAHMPLTGSSGFDLYHAVDGRDTYLSSFIPVTSSSFGYSSGTKTYGEFTEYTLNFPLYDQVMELYIGLKKDAVLEQPAPYRIQKPVVFYGNSITQGGCASRPGNCCQAILSRRLSMDFINLGFSSSGKGESEMAQYIAGLEMSALVMDYDSNAPTPEHLRSTHFPFYKVIRDAQPDLPIIFISHASAGHPVYYDLKISEEWGTFDKRRSIIRETFDRARADGDQNVCFIDGREIYTGDAYDSCTVDGGHPNDFGFLLWADRLEKTLAPLLK